MLPTLVHDDAPEEIPRSHYSLGMTLTPGGVTPSNWVARSLHAASFSP